MPRHQLTHINEKTRTAKCSVCGETKIHKRNTTINGFINWRCDFREKRKNRRKGFKQREAILFDDSIFDKLFKKQNGRCAMCKKKTILCLDHDHLTFLIRGLLCRRCNLVLGLVNDNTRILKEGVNYLSAPSSTSADHAPLTVF